MQNFRYVSEGESFTLADPNEVWVVEMIGRGDLGFGAVWVAKKVPDGHLHAHANQARITELIEEEKGTTMLWSDDVIQFAIDNKVCNSIMFRFRLMRISDFSSNAKIHNHDIIYYSSITLMMDHSVSLTFMLQ